MKLNYCKIYLESSKSSNELTEWINSNIPSSEIEIYIDENEEFDIEKEKTFPDGFLFFKYLVELHFPVYYSKNECVNVINSILSSVWKEKMPAVASYDFESDLICQGGYSSKEIPWPGAI